MFQDLVIGCSVYSNIIGLLAKHCFCSKLGKFKSQSKVKIGNKSDWSSITLSFILFSKKL